MGLLEDLVMTPGVTGYERPVRERIIQELKGLPHSVDNIGNLHYVFGKGSPKVLVMAHMDELGLYVSRIEETGAIRFRKVGGLDDVTIPGRHWLIWTSKGPVPAVAAQRPPHLYPNEPDRERRFATDEMYLDAGANSRAEAERLGISVLDMVTPVKTFSYLANGRVAARALDDRAGCYALIEIVRKVAKAKIGCEAHLVFTVQEEIGLRGAAVASRKIKPDLAIAIDTVSVPGADGLPANVPKMKPGDGALLRMVDSRAVASQEFRENVKALARRKRIKVCESLTGGSTDMAEAQLEGARAIPICFPVRHTHTMVECISLNDLEAVVSIVVEVIKGAKGMMK